MLTLNDFTKSDHYYEDINTYEMTSRPKWTWNNGQLSATIIKDVTFDEYLWDVYLNDYGIGTGFTNSPEEAVTAIQSAIYNLSDTKSAQAVNIEGDYPFLDFRHLKYNGEPSTSIISVYSEPDNLYTYTIFNQAMDLAYATRKGFMSSEEALQNALDFTSSWKFDTKIAQSKNKADYAYTPTDNPSDWKLNISDARHCGGAKAALGKGYMGNKVDIPAEDRAGVIAKVNAACKKFGLEPFKEAKLADIDALNYIEDIDEALREKYDVDTDNPSEVYLTELYDNVEEYLPRLSNDEFDTLDTMVFDAITLHDSIGKNAQSNKEYYIVARNRGMWGITEPVKENGEVVYYATEEEARTEAKRLNDEQGPINRFNQYFVSEASLKTAQSNPPFSFSTDMNDYDLYRGEYTQKKEWANTTYILSVTNVGLGSFEWELEQAVNGTQYLISFETENSFESAVVSANKYVANMFA